ncbi:MAG: proprotein convertase P-domain-containing protein [Parasphingorhabdus sp.]|uniref:proprotein convertase P-domain-containing protein n=1 Tax=Parasphingorhabdus sp. TaxID=2709688 RepID=UPI0030032DE3
MTRSAMHKCAKGFVETLLGLFAIAMFFGSAQAQAATINYTNSTDATISENATPCTNPLLIPFSVGTSYTVSDVNIGILIGHTYRGDLLMYLRSPAGTRVEIFSGTGAGADNFNVQLDDAFGTSVSTHSSADTATAGTSVPPYQRNFSPANALTAFNGQNSSGTWRLEICDRFNGDSGSFYQANLSLTDTPTNFADLSLSKSVNNAAPTNGAAIAYTLQVTNAAASPNTATDVVVRDILPAGVTFVSASGFGSYNNATGNWSVGTVAPGQTRALTINATVNATSGAVITNTAEITASSIVDIDSTPNNGNTGEDDYAARSFTVAGTRTAGTPPNLSTICSPANQILFDWNGKSWASGSLNNSFTIAGIGSVNFTLSTDGSFQSSPEVNNSNTGAFGTGQQSLYQFLEFTNKTQSSTTIVTLPTAVPGLQFTIFDVDYAANDFADKFTVTGTYNGATVYPTLTNGIANYVVGNSVIGDAGSDSASANGNVVVTFLAPVDTISIVYGNHTTAPDDPDGQAASIYDFNFCRPNTALSITKISQVISDPVNGTANPKAIPGAIIQYCILISNAGSATAASINATDTIPGNITYTAGTMRSGNNCGSAATVEDDNATGADETDPFGAAISGTVLTATAASLVPAQAYALTFQVTVN